MSDSLQTLLQVRMRGARPASGLVDVWFGNAWRMEKCDWLDAGRSSAEVVIRSSENVEVLDVRCLVGLGITLWIEEWTSKVERLVQRIKEVSPWFLQVFIGTDGSKLIGFAWSPKTGEMTIESFMDGGIQPCN